MMKGWKLYVLLAAAVAVSFLARFCEPLPGDVSLIRWVQTCKHPEITAFMKAVSTLGKSWIVIGLAGAAVAGLFVLRRRQECLTAAGVLFILILSPILQLFVDRSRPPADMVGLDVPFSGLSFPSGHAYQSFVFFGFLIYLCNVLIGRVWLRRSVQALLASLILAIGVSRVYLGAHWPSDVLGSYLIGGSFLALLFRAYQTRVPSITS